MSNPQNKLLVRHAILLQLAASSPVPLPLPTLQEGLRLLGHLSDNSSLLPHLDYLTQKQYINTSRSALCAADCRYSLSAAGCDYLEAEGLL